MPSGLNNTPQAAVTVAVDIEHLDQVTLIEKGELGARVGVLVDALDRVEAGDTVGKAAPELESFGRLGQATPLGEIDETGDVGIVRQAVVIYPWSIDLGAGRGR